MNRKLSWRFIFNYVRNIFTTLIFLLTMMMGRESQYVSISNDFVRIKRPRQQVANRGGRFFRMSEHELAFVERVLTRKPNLQIYRTHQVAPTCDFVIIDRSDSQYIVGWVVELKTAPNSAHAGIQLSRADEH